MEFAAKQRNRHPLISRIAGWLESPFYPMTFALLCVISGMGGKHIYLPILLILVFLIVFSALFAKDNKVFLVPIFMVFYGVGNDTKQLLTDETKELIDVYDPAAFVILCVITVVAVAAILLRLWKDGSFAHAVQHRSSYTYSIAAISVALLLNGLFSQQWQPMNLLYGFWIAVGFFCFYWILRAIIQRSQTPTVYICICMVCTACILLLQLLILAIQLYAKGDLFEYYISQTSNQLIYLRLRRENIHFGAWGGYATNIAATLILGIPAAMYLTKNGRFPLLTYSLSVLFWLGALLTGTRSAFLVGAIVFIVCAILAVRQSKKRARILLFSFALLLCTVAILLYIHQNIYPLGKLWKHVLKLLRLDDFSQFGRFELWTNGWRDFLSCPLFGVGFMDGGYETAKKIVQISDIFQIMYHNIVIEFMGAMGLVGLFAFLWHCKSIAKRLLFARSVDNVLLLMIPLTILTTSLADNFFFHLSFQIFYLAFLALEEQDCPHRRLRSAQK